MSWDDIIPLVEQAQQATGSYREIVPLRADVYPSR